MSVLVVGSTALDSIKTPKAENPRLLGGSASHAAVAASFFSPVKLVGVVGDDFPKAYLDLYQRHRIDLEGLQILPGKTFTGRRYGGMNIAGRRFTELETECLRRRRRPPGFAVRAMTNTPRRSNTASDQVRRPRFVVADTMDCGWALRSMICYGCSND
jgi:hypothetical protein